MSNRKAARRPSKAASTVGATAIPPRPLLGAGAHAVRRAQAVLRQLAQQAPITDGVPGAVAMRTVVVRDGERRRAVRAPAIVQTPVSLVARLISRRAAATSAAPGSEMRRPRAAVVQTLNVPPDARAAETTGLELIADRIRAAAGTMLDATTGGTILGRTSLNLPENAVHDFSQYAFLRDVNALTPVAAASSGPPLGNLEQFLADARAEIRAAILGFCEPELDVAPYLTRNLVPLFPQFEATLYKLFLSYAAPGLFELAARVRPGYAFGSGDVRKDVLGAFREWLIALIQRARFDPASLERSFDNPDAWKDVVREVERIFLANHRGAEVGTHVDPPPEDYPFSPYPLDVVNFGLQIVFRQEWRPLGTQPGEIVRTIPLGPKQVEKISIKVVNTSKQTTSQETSTSTESNTEASEVTKDSTDVVREASSSLKLHADMEASGGYGPVSAKLSAGVASESASSSKDTKSHLNDTMQKTATKMRRDVKVAVSTERTFSEETSRTSEISNPNDEVCVTYVYSKLQRQYEICTTMAEVNSVVFVPEPVPAWSEITATWIARHDWILAKALLDASFAEDLAQISREPPEPEAPEGPDAVGAAAGKVADAIGTYASFSGVPDFFDSVLGNYERKLAKDRELAASVARRTQREDRLIAHVRANILHYMRAIWSSEDSDQRMRRYARITVPTRWDFVPAGGTDPIDPAVEVAGEFVPSYDPESLRPLTDVIHPAGPIGFCGNYAVFYMRRDPRLACLNGALSVLRASYVRFEVTVEPADEVTQAFALLPRARNATYDVRKVAPGKWEATQDGVGVPLPIVSRRNDTELDLEGLKIRFDAPPRDGAALRVHVEAMDDLEDPELRTLRDTSPLPSRASEPRFFTPKVLSDMATYVPELAEALLPQGPTWETLPDAVRQLARDRYHEYALLRDSTRRFLMETNNVILDLEVGKTASLEEFKRLHRVVDVLKELEEATRRSVENERRTRRLGAGDLADPDIESVTVVGSPDELRTIVGPVVVAPTPVPAPQPEPEDVR